MKKKRGEGWILDDSEQGAGRRRKKTMIAS